MNDRLDRITLRAEGNDAATFNNLFSLLNVELLFYAFRKLKRNKAPGVDGQSVDDYEENLQVNLQSLEDRIHSPGGHKLTFLKWRVVRAAPLNPAVRQ